MKNRKLEWAIFYEWSGKGGFRQQPIFGSGNGKYYLGGNRSISYLLFASKAEAEKVACEVRKDPWFKNDKNIYQGRVRVLRFRIEPID